MGNMTVAGFPRLKRRGLIEACCWWSYHHRVISGIMAQTPPRQDTRESASFLQFTALTEMEMAETHLISGLMTKRAEVAGELAKLRRRLIAVQQDIAAIDRILALSGYQGEPETIQPIERREAQPYRRGSLANGIMDVLRERSEPTRMTVVAEMIAAERGIMHASASAREDFHEHVRQAMRRLRLKGIVEAVGEGAATAWRIAE